MCVCVCVCVCKERERQTDRQTEGEKYFTKREYNLIDRKRVRTCKEKKLEGNRLVEGWIVKYSKYLRVSK